MTNEERLKAIESLKEFKHLAVNSFLNALMLIAIFGGALFSVVTALYDALLCATICGMSAMTVYQSVRFYLKARKGIKNYENPVRYQDD